MFFRKILLSLTALVLIFGFSATVHALSYTFTTIDPGDSNNEALGINNDGTVVGRYKDSSGIFHGFVYDGASSTLDLPGYFKTQAMGINDAGKIVGMSYDKSIDGAHHSFLYDGNWSYPIDPPGSNVVDSLAEDINNFDVMVGRYWDTDGFFYGYVRTGGVFNILHAPGSGNTLAEGINDAGKIAGTYGDANGTHGFLYNGGSYSTFDILGSSETRFTDINNADKIVGRYMDNGIYHSFIYNGTYSMIAVPGATETRVIKINDADQIVGTYYDGSGMHAFIGTPVVPEPSTIFLFGSGLIGLISFKRNLFLMREALHGSRGPQSQ